MNVKVDATRSSDTEPAPESSGIWTFARQALASADVCNGTQQSYTLGRSPDTEKSLLGSFRPIKTYIEPYSLLVFMQGRA